MILNDHLDYDNFNSSFILAQKKFKEFFKKRKNLILRLFWVIDMKALAFWSKLFFEGIKIAHIHGGEITEGSIDDTIRHLITKLSNIHYVTNLEHQRRVIQLGEKPKKEL